MLNSVTAFLDEHIALGAADRPAIVTPSGASTYGTLLARANRTGNAFRALRAGMVGAEDAGGL